MKLEIDLDKYVDSYLPGSHEREPSFKFKGNLNILNDENEIIGTVEFTSILKIPEECFPFDYGKTTIEKVLEKIGEIKLGEKEKK